MIWITFFITYNFVFLTFLDLSSPSCVKPCAHKKTAVACMYMHTLKFWLLIWIVLFIIYNFVLLTIYIWILLHIVKTCACKKTVVMCMHTKKFWQLIWVVFLFHTTLCYNCFTFEHSFMAYKPVHIIKQL